MLARKSLIAKRGKPGNMSTASREGIKRPRARAGSREEQKSARQAEILAELDELVGISEIVVENQCGEKTEACKGQCD